METQDEPLWRAETEEEGVGVNKRETVSLTVSLVVALFDVVAHTLCVMLPICEKEGVKLEEAVNEVECVSLALLLAEALCVTVAHALSVALSHCERERV